MPKRKAQEISHDTQCYVFDFTFFGKDEWFPTHVEFIKLIRPLFKKWCFQLERAPTTNKLHYQGRGSLFKKKRHPELCALLNQTDLKGMNISETEKENSTGDPFYVMKLDSREDGPWSDVTFKEPAYIPRQFRGLEDRLYGYQISLIEKAQVFDSRIIHLIYDPTGNKGKSTISALLQLLHNGIDLPPIGDHKELTQIVCDMLIAKQERSPGAICLDLPRALTMDKKKLAPYMIAIEQIKKGHVCDCRHHYKEWWFDSPPMFIFCNEVPDLKYLSKDRWKLWTIDHFNNLQHYIHIENEPGEP